MIGQSIVKAHRLKLAVSIGTLVCGLVTGGFAAVAFAGHTEGDFTIALNQSGIRLALDEDKDVENPSTFMKVEDYPAFDVTYFDNVMTHKDNLDTPTTNRVIGVEPDPDNPERDVTRFFKYTFFLKNIGTTVANYSFSINITKNTKPDRGDFTYDEILRVMLFENDANDLESHNYEVFAKRANYESADLAPKDENGNPIYDTRISSVNSIFDTGYATQFKSKTRVCELQHQGFKPGDAMRYTMVAWLEGFDPESSGGAPSGGDLQLGIDIDGSQI